MNSPLVSIAIPAYRPGLIFQDTLRSCLLQDYPNYEVVIALDDEDEHVRNAVKEADDSRVRLVTDGKRYGQFGNFNRAVDESRGDFIKLLSSDDLMARDCLTRMVEALDRNTTVGLCTSPHISFRSREDGSIHQTLHVPLPVTRVEWVYTSTQGRWFTARYGNQIGGPSNVMIRRSAWLQTGGFDPRMNHCGEPALWYRLVSDSGLVLLSRPLIGYRMHDNSVTGRGALSYKRINEPFEIAETATLGAAFPNVLWFERSLRILETVNSTANYAGSMLRRDFLLGIKSLWRVWTSGGLVLLPFTTTFMLWALLRSGFLRIKSKWPFREFLGWTDVTAPNLTVEMLLDILTDTARIGRLVEKTTP